MPRAMSPPQPARDGVVDVARGIGIVLVVLGHNRAVSMASPGFVDALFLFHIPLFFLLSGLVQRAQPPRAALATLASRLLVPFLVAALVVGILKSATRGIPLGDTLLGIAWATGQTLPWSHLWFLPTLMLVLFVMQLVRLLPAAPVLRWSIGAALALVVAVSMPPQRGPDLGAFGFASPVGWPWGADLVAIGLAFGFLGALLRDAPRVRVVLLHPATTIACVFVFAGCIGAELDLNRRVWSPPVSSLAAALAGCGIAFAFARLLANWRPAELLLAMVGRHTLVIFLLHVSTQKGLLAGLDASGAIPESSAGLLVVGLATAALSIAITLALSVAWSASLTRWRQSHGPAPSLPREVST